MPSFIDKKGQYHWYFRCECGNIKIINAVNVRSGQTKSCGCSQLGWKPSVEAKQKMREAKLGKKQSKEHIANNKESKRKLFASGHVSPLKGRPSKLKGVPKLHMRGKNSPCWIANRMDLVKNEKKHLDGRYREWMMAIKDRDGWKCRIGNKDCKGRLEAHHILRWSKFPKLRYEVNNGITLCHFHHPRKINDEMKLVPTFRGLIKVK